MSTSSSSMSTFEGIQYDVEGDIDFFKELQNISTSSTSDAAHADAVNRCLLTDEELRPDAVTLKCGHSFNYIPLYKEVLFQKCSTLPKNISSRIMALYTKTANPNIGYTSPLQSFQHVQTMTYNSSINLETTKLHYDEIKCPYCRDITPKLLPYYPYPEVNQVKYVNSPSGLCLKGVACEYYKMFPAKAGKINNNSTDNHADKTCDSCPIYNKQYGLLCRTHLKKVSASKSLKPKSVNSIVSHIDPTTLPTESIYPIDIDNTKCGFTLLMGARKGQPCGCVALKITATTSAPLCKRHNNK
jgi:hypothetical protein